MKRWFSLLLIVSLFLSLTPDRLMAAVNLRLADDIAYVTEKGIWSKSGDYEPEKSITRGETAGMIARAIGSAKVKNPNLLNDMYQDVSGDNPDLDGIIALTALEIMKGSEGKFRPNDTVTREELAVILNRTYDLITGGMTQHPVVERSLIDHDEISDWAKQDVANAMGNGIMHGVIGKLFEPKASVTRGQMANLMAKLHNKEMKRMSFHEKDASRVDPTSSFAVYQKGTLVSKRGVAGFGLIARFNGAPGEIYVARTTTKPAGAETGTIIAPISFARVINPDGIVVARCDLDYMESGKMAKIITIPEGQGGIYQIQIINGRTGDLVEVGVNGAKSWGVRGELWFRHTETTPNPAYVYVPEKAGIFSLATSGATFNLEKADGKGVASSVTVNRNTARQAIDLSEFEKDTVYRVVFPEGFKDEFSIIGVSRIICPSEEMALDIKGNYTLENGYQFAGRLQADARKEMLRIYERAGGDFNPVIEKPEQLPEVIQNPIGEAQLLSAYNGSIAALAGNLTDQNLDPKSPLFGSFPARRGLTKIHKIDWEAGYIDNQMTIQINFAGAAAIHGQLNYFYGNQQLVDRVALGLLFTAQVMSEEGCLLLVNPDVNVAGLDPWTYSNFRLPDLMKSYEKCRSFFDPETVRILDEAFMIMADKHMLFSGLGVTNQWFFSPMIALSAYRLTGDEMYHDTFKRHMRAIDSTKNWPNYGQAPAGYYIEDGGCDADYQYMNVTDIGLFNIYYMDMPTADPEIKEILRESSQKCLEFEAKFAMTYPKELLSIGANHFSSRTESKMGSPGGHTGFCNMMDRYPLARRLWENIRAPLETENLNPVMGHYINSEELAMRHLKEVYPAYDQYFGFETNRNTNVTWTYNFFEKEMPEAALLPCESPTNQIWDDPGIVAVKHNGIYLFSFYNNTIPKLSARAWMGGGPSGIWSQGTGGTVNSLKHINYASKPQNADEVISSCIFGNDASGNLFVSGKELAQLTWIEEGKMFEIKGHPADSPREVFWRYSLEDDGILVTAGVSSYNSAEEFWINIPIVSQTPSDWVVKPEDTQVVVEYRGNKMFYSWDEETKSEFLHEPVGPSWGPVKRLRLKLSDEGSVSFKIEMEEAK